MNRSRVTPLFLSAVLLGGCINVRSPQSAAAPQPRDPCAVAPEICAETQVNLALIAAVKDVELSRQHETSRMLTRLLNETKDPVVLARLHARILDRLDSSDPAVRKSQQDALGEAGLREKDIRSQVIRCDEVPSKDGGMTLYCN